MVASTRPIMDFNKRSSKIAVIAIGGNSLIKDPKHVSVEDQLVALRETAVHLADLIEAGWTLAITHGNGPQIGFMLRRSEIAAKQGMFEEPLDVCGADTQGAIGYELQQVLQNELYKRRVNKNVATIITQTLVDINDPAFQNPTKPIGGFMDESEAKMRQQENGWICVEDSGRGWRRVVASPMPKEIVELDSIKYLLNGGVQVITVGGGGIPVIDNGAGEYIGATAVIDKDHASSLLATSLKADLFLIVTAIEKVAIKFGKPDQQLLDYLTVTDAIKYNNEGHFPKGSMGPKVGSCVEFIKNGGQFALITSIEKIGDALKGKTGTWILSDM